MDELADEGVGHGVFAAVFAGDVDGAGADVRPLLHRGLGEAGQTAEPGAEIGRATEAEVAAGVLHRDEDAGCALGELRRHGLGGFEGLALDAERVVDRRDLREAAEEDDAVGALVGRAGAGGDAA